MNLTVTPQRYNNYYNNQSPAFKAKIKPAVAMDEAENFLSKTAKQDSNLFQPFKKFYGNFTDFIADKFTSRFVEWKPLEWTADKLKNTDNLFQHCLTVGSMVTSGLYVQRTLTNKDLDSDRRNTLAVNQALTFGVSTLGAYVLDKYIKGWWENITARFAGHLLQDRDFYPNFLKEKNTIIEENKKLKAAGKTEFKSLPKLNKLVENHNYYKNLGEADAKVLMTKLKGMGPLRTMIVFGFVYRFFVPVAVTKPANKLCEKYLAYKAEKEKN